MFGERLASLNRAVAGSVVGRYFRLRGSGCSRPRDTDFTTEVQAGVTAFLALAYIIGLNAAIVAESGGTCVCVPAPGALGANLQCKNDIAYLSCKREFQRDIAAATSVVTGIGSVLMGVLANLPIELSCGLGATVFFVYNMVGYHGSGEISYHTALGAVFFEGLVFILLTLLGVRQWLAKLLPASLKHATCVGLGLFICFIGMREDTGIGLIGPNATTFVSLSGCNPATRDLNIQECESDILNSPKTLLGIMGVILMTVLTMFRVRGAILIGILVVSMVSWIRHTPFTYFPDNETGNPAYEYFTSIVDFHTLKNTMVILSFDIWSRKALLALATLLYLDLLDTTGTIFTHASMMDMVDEDGDFDGATSAFLCDGATISIGSLFGMPPVTALLDSGIGITEGGRTGIVAIVAGVLFFLSTILTPIFTSFPPWATGPSLIMVGVLMSRNATMIPWEFPGEAVPAFLTITLMPLTFSVVNGILAGILSYILIHILARIITFATHGSLVPLSPLDSDDCDLNDRRVSTLPPWISALKACFSRWFS